MCHLHVLLIIMQKFIIGGVINGIINGIINWYMVKDKTDLVLASASLDSITHSVVAGSLFLAVSLAFILTGVAYMTSAQRKLLPFFPKVFMLALWHTTVVFIVMSILVALTGYVAGGTPVTPLQSVFITFIVATIIAIAIEFFTHQRLRNVEDPARKFL